MQRVCTTGAWARGPSGRQTSGCSGLAYVLEFVDDLDEGDAVFEDRGVKVIIDQKSLAYLDGTELDYGKEGLNGVQVQQPQCQGPMRLR